MGKRRLNKADIVVSCTVALVLGAAVFFAAAGKVSLAGTDASPAWTFNATVMEGCSCPMFCQCYFNTAPAIHQDGDTVSRYCRFNNVFNVNAGSKYGDVDLGGVKFWLAGDLGTDFSDGRVDWGILTFDPSVTAPQREAIMAILTKLFPAQWDSFEVAKDASISWMTTKDRAEAKLGNGEIAELVLKSKEGIASGPVVIKNLRWEAEDSNDGFILMPNEIQAYRGGKHPFETKGTNGFMITVHMASK